MTNPIPAIGEPLGSVVRLADPALALLVDPRSALVRLAGGGTWVEGPVWLPREQAVQYSEIPHDRALRWSEADGLRVVREPNDFTNGNTLDREGRLVHCEHGNRRISRTELDGTRIGLVERHAGGRLNSPNDVVVKRDGTVWFTDPPYGILSDHEGHAAPMEQAGCFVYRFDPDTSDLSVVTDWLTHPNGLAFSPDESTLYVADTYAAVEPTAPRHIVAFDLADGRRATDPRIFHATDEGLFDGFRVDVEGNVWTSSQDGVRIVAPDGHELGRILVPEVVSNCVFGGPDGRRLFITASTSLYAISVRVLGAGVGAAVGRGEVVG